MARKEIYDFGTVLDILMRSQTDLIEIVTKWGEMLDTRPRYVEFNLSGQDTLRVPNIQMVVDTLNERSLPERPSFLGVNVIGQNGMATINNGGIGFSGSGDLHASYDVNGIEGSVWKVDADATIRTWPLPRYWDIVADTQKTITVSPGIETSMVDSMADFFVIARPGKSVKIVFQHYGGVQSADKLVLACPGTRTAIWHVAVVASKRPQSGGMICTGRATLMEEGM